jgi:hypothetical protein
VGAAEGELCVIGQRVHVAAGAVVAAGEERDAEGAAAVGDAAAHATVRA